MGNEANKGNLKPSTTSTLSITTLASYKIIRFYQEFLMQFANRAIAVLCSGFHAGIQLIGRSNLENRYL